MPPRTAALSAFTGGCDRDDGDDVMTLELDHFVHETLLLLFLRFAALRLPVVGLAELCV